MATTTTNTGGGATQVSSSVASKAGTPSWEVAILDSLSNQGSLNGVNPNDIVGIGYAEQGYGGVTSGGARSSTGAGGFFGLSSNTPYSYGGNTFSISSSQLSGSSAADYTAQAETASAVFATGLQAAKGNVLGAESYYQTGSTSGTSSGAGLFKNLGIGGNQGTGQAASSQTTSGSSTSSGLSNPIFGVLGGPSIAGVGFFFLAIVLLLIGGLVLVAGTLKGKGGSMPVPV
jgi:hypothetical protein